MSYKIYTDRNENFECEVAVKNASLKGSIARLVIESENYPSLVFNGSIKGNKCNIPIKRLKGILDENTRGKIHLEVIVEDTYFKPWESDFIVEEHTSVKVSVNEQKQSNKPMVKVAVKETRDDSLFAKKQIAYICERFGINKNNLKNRKEDVLQILKEYFKANNEYNNHAKVILSGFHKFLK